MHHFSTANMLDRAILSVAPRRGLDRIEAKTRARILMNYDGASKGRRLKGWKAPATDADAASQAGRARLRQLSRDFVRNAPFARRARDVVANNVVGAGVAPSVVASNKRDKARAEKLILGHLKSKNLDTHGENNLFAQQSIVMNSVFESGEMLVLRHDRDAAAGLKLPFQTELLEVDHLNPTITVRGGNEVQDGVEYDDAGRIVAYHIYEQHPGSARRNVSLKSNRWSADRVLHIRRLERPGQSRGVPWLAPVMVTLGELRDYQEAQILKQKISALLVGVVKTGASGTLTEAQKNSGLGNMAPGALVYLEEGQEVTFSDPPSVNDYDQVMRLGLQAVAMGLGLTTESLSGDLSRVNFSSMRGGRLEMDKNVETWQQRIIVEQFCEGIAGWAVNAYRLTPDAKSVSLEWTAPKRALIDPAKEVGAIIKKVDAGLTSLQREQRGMGLDPDVIQREREEDAARIVPVLPDPETKPKGNEK
jgi:lambda family phage portal protein